MIEDLDSSKLVRRVLDGQEPDLNVAAMLAWNMTDIIINNVIY